MSKKSILDFNKMKGKEPITWITAYDYPFAQVAEKAGIEMILVGDSGTMVQLGYKSTNLASMYEMLLFAKAVRRGAPDTFCVGDMPQGSYEVSNEEAVRNSLKFVKEAFCDAVKLEGGKRMCDRVKAISDAGILCIGHLGLTPQSVASFGGYRVQCKNLESFDQTVEDALALQEAGACMILLEALPNAAAKQISKLLKIPIMGIGAGIDCDAQLVIMHDLMGFYQDFRPWFAKCYIPDVIKDFDIYIDQNRNNLKKLGKDTRTDGLLHLAELAIKKYISEVKERKFPSPEYTYPLKEEELNNLRQSIYWNKENE